MKKLLFPLLLAVIIAVFATSMHAYQMYIKTSEELLLTLEEMCEQNDIPWGDTVCETDVWEEYCEAREALGLEYLEHFSKR